MDFILGPLYTLFGWLTRVFYDFFGNYGVAIITLTVLIRGLLIPLNIKSQKSMLKMQALSSKQAELQRKYGDDKKKLQEEMVKMQQENGAMGFSGCLLPFLQLFFIWPIYRIVSGPLIYLSQVPSENVSKMIELGQTMNVIGKTVSEKIHIGLVSALNTNGEFLNSCISKGYIALDQLLDLHFLGVDLTMVPSFNPVTIIAQPKVYLPLLLIPILVVLTQVLTMQFSKFLKPGYKQEQEAKQRAKNNPAREGQIQENSQTEMTMKMMNWSMPLIMLVTTFTMPAAMGLYWIVGGIMGLLTQVLVYFLFTKPYELKKAELEAKKEAVFKKKAAASSEAEDEQKNSNKKKKNKRK
ncbi:YidC/Oxa1 family membrane protein insertase [Ruminococcaceae bacterium YRB3002]|nr:YidC/Oxa1 family membrane protein insertase [Ruminococcaceae bacterium YRB3002]